MLVSDDRGRKLGVTTSLVVSRGRIFATIFHPSLPKLHADEEQRRDKSGDADTLRYPIELFEF